MLVLSRRDGETIKVGSDVVVRIVRISGGRVRVGIEAPKATRILRGELPENSGMGKLCDPQTHEAPAVTLVQQSGIPINPQRFSA